MHQDYQFAFFPLDQGDDPPVYFFHEAQVNTYNGVFARFCDSFTEFLNKELEMHDIS